MALAPLLDQRVPGRLSGGPNVRHPASTTPLPTWMPRSRYSSYLIRSRLPRKYRTHAATSPYRALNGSSSRTTLATRPASMSALTSANRRSRSAPSGWIAFTALDAYSRQWKRPGTNVTFPPPKSSSQVFRIHSAPSETTTGPPAS